MKLRKLAGAAAAGLALILLYWGAFYGEEPGKEGVHAPTTGQTARTGEEPKEEAGKTEGTGTYEITRTNDEERTGTTEGTRGNSGTGAGPSSSAAGSSGLQRSLGSTEEDYETLDREFHERAAAERQAAAENTEARSSASRQLPSRGSAATYYDAGIFQITAYTAGYESTGKRPGDPAYGVTATGTTVEEGRTIAADWSVLPPGTVVRIQGLEGYYTVEDRGGAIQGKIIDLYIADLEEAITWGRQERKIYVKEWGEW